MSPTAFLLLNLALAFYNVGTIWAMEVDIFRSWRFAGQREFHAIQSIHWRKLPYWIFAPRRPRPEWFSPPLRRRPIGGRPSMGRHLTRVLPPRVTS
jgi:hypothetical protein